MINICYMISYLGNCGPVNILYGIIKNLDKKQFKVIIITLKEEKSNSRIKEFENLGIKVILCNISDFEIMCSKTFKLNSIIEQENIDIIHAQCSRSSIFISKLEGGYEKISTIHCDFSTNFIYEFGITMGKIYSFLYLKALKKMDLNISCGKGVAALIWKNNILKTQVVQNGIDREKINIKNIKLTKEELRKKLNLKENKKYFVSVGSLSEGKNVLFLAKYFSNTEIENISLILLGTGNKREEIINLKSSNIKLTGKLSLEEVQEYLKVSDFYISASRTEGLPNSVLEALEFELPVLLSNIEPHKEILENYDCGELFELDNIDSLESKIKKILNKIKDNEEYKKIKVFIDAKRMSKEYEKIYYSLVKDLNNKYT
ncbi:glycosyltransferase [Fusobacterium varium]|uniref:glycosyltransferase n=1 Tax=Fusobacterium varium TaxID=856 RepID=UPI001F3DB2C9|nr:glycosyltransferase [Fusobacterium varium]MCF2674274.1 glycosyltransferase [Fusobacterium varium]